MTELLTAENLIALLTLTALEIVLGIDNIVFIAILVQRLPERSRARARRIGLLLAMVMRILLLFSINWIRESTATLFSAFGHPVSARDLILIGGGLFLLGKATLEIHHKLETPGECDAAEGRTSPAVATLGGVLVQIMLLDLVFSLDSVITAVGMARHLGVMVAAVVIAVGVMMVFAGAVSRFIDRHPTIKILALSFLLLIGVMLVVEGCVTDPEKHINKGYIYFAMAFALVVELLNLRVIKNYSLLRRKERGGASSDAGSDGT